MNTMVRKTIASIAAFVVSFSLVSPVVTSAASEFYSYASDLAEQGIINAQSTEAGYRLGDNVLRQEVVKMVVNTADLSTSACAGSFSDVSAVSPNDWVCGYVEAALANGIISANSTFRPTDTITRAEALKMSMEALGFDAVASSDIVFADVTSGWQKAYVDTAVANGIISSSNANFRPNDAITRGEFFKILSKLSMDSGNVADMDEDTSSDDDLANLLGDLLGTDDEDVANMDEDTSSNNEDTSSDVVIDGSLGITLSPETPVAQNIPSTAANVEFMAFDVTADEQDVSISEIVLTRVDLGSKDDFKKVWISQEGVVISNDKTISSDDTVTIPVDIVVEAGSTETFTVNASMNGVVSTVNAFELTSVDANQSIDFNPIRGNSMTTVSYSVAEITLTPKGTASNIDASEADEIIGEFKLEESESLSKKGVIVKSIRFKAAWGIDISNNLENIALYENGSIVSTSTIIDGDYVTFKLDDLYIEDAKSLYFEIKANVISGDDGDTIAFSVKDDFDIYAIEEDTAIGASIVKGSSLATYTLNAGKTTLSQDISTPSSEEYISDSDEILAFVAKVDTDQPVLVDSLRLFIDSSTVLGGAQTTKTQLDKEVENVRVYVNDRIIDSVDTVTAGAGWAANVLDGNAYYDFDSSFEVSDNDLIKVYIDLTKDAVAGTKLKFKLDNAGTSAGNSLSLLDVEYVSDGETIAQAKLTGSATSNIVEVVSAGAGASIVRNDGFSNETFLAGEQGATLMQFVVNAGNSSSLEIKKLNFDVTRTWGSYTDYTNFKLLKNGSQVGGTEDLGSTDSLTITDINTVISEGGQATFELIADIDTSTTSTWIQVNLDSDDSVFYDINDNEVLDSANAADVTGDTSTVSSNAVLAVAIDGDTSDAAIVVADTMGVELGKYKFTATDGDINIKDLYFRNTVTGADARISSLKLVVNGSVIDSRVPSSDVIHFDLGSSSQIVVPKNDDVVITVEADFNSITSAAQTNKGIILELTDIKADTAATSKALTVVNGTTAIDDGDHYTTSALAATNIVSERADIRKTQPTVTIQDLGTTKLSNGEQSIFKFTVTADSSEDIEVAQIKFNVVDSANRITANTYKLYLNGTDKTADGAFVGSVFTFGANSNAVVSAGTSKTFELKATLAGVVSDDYISVKLVEDAAALSSGVETKANAVADANSNFIWSDTSGSPHSDTTVDYFNGQNVIGLDTTTVTLTN